MITAAFIYLVLGLIYSLVVFMPEFNPIPGNFYDLIVYIVNFTYSFDYIIPVSTLFQVLMAGLYVHFLMFGLNLMILIFRWVRLLPS